MKEARIASGWAKQYILLLTPLLLLVLLLPAVQADELVVRLLFFYSLDCEHCQVVMDEVLPPLQEKYGAQLEVQSIEISDHSPGLLLPGRLPGVRPR